MIYLILNEIVTKGPKVFELFFFFLQIDELVFIILQFISADMHGIWSRLFCDFGDEFEVSDTTGEEPKEIFVSNITQVRLYMYIVVCVYD